MGEQYQRSRLGVSGARVQQCLSAGRPAFVGYYPVGYPTVPRSIEAIRAIVEGVEGRGADMVEIGIPYSDPLMDGVVIQRAARTAREAGVRTRDLFPAAQAVADQGAVPLTMTYWNLVEAYGVEAFARDFAAAGGGGVITPDLPADDCEEWIEATDRHGVDRIFLVAPSSTDERLAMTMRASRGWVYATSVMGVTGARDHTSDAAPVIVERARAADPTIPVGIGLGVSDGDQAAEIGAFADLVIVGSALIRTVADRVDDWPAALDALRSLAGEIALGVERSRR
ncbi:tryptophan synthase subunit alpha [uncultured Tessaracoccus sp.]|uniref:tryptophan synthase subunit alpha n=1 Tax=uncultured Tessaracoccus sp. TaxID=905023 RepID=UPI0025E6C43C|nr:tryptophan synthase subunit alpha [uncultured Tessaracoccus sp.]